MSAEILSAHLSTSVPELKGRVQMVADLQELIRRDRLPQAPVFAFVVPLGLNAVTQGDAAANAFSQMVDEVFGLVLVHRAAGDLAGEKSLVPLDRLVWSVIACVCGYGADNEVGVFRLLRGRLVSLLAGTAFYQLDFAMARQIRVMS